MSCDPGVIKCLAKPLGNERYLIRRVKIERRHEATIDLGADEIEALGKKHDEDISVDTFRFIADVLGLDFRFIPAS